MKPVQEETQSNREDFLGHRVCLVLDGSGRPGGIWIRTAITATAQSYRKNGGVSHTGRADCASGAFSRYRRAVILPTGRVVKKRLRIKGGQFMSRRNRQAFDTLSRDLVLRATDRMETLRSMVERADSDRRETWERTLDRLRGLNNRAIARIEAAHMADDDAWPFARAQADQAMMDLMRALDDFDGHLRLLAA
ncbi:hypothetical protein AZL_011840 [Azospirillum sp. B510]|nr:hypothetical protein AZL_011840 [Azospirillum sp. B510]